MRGNNTMVLNQSTMLAAMQLWLNDQFKEPPIAASISQDKSDGQFTLSVKSTETKTTT